MGLDTVHGFRWGWVFFEEYANRMELIPLLNFVFSEHHSSFIVALSPSFLWRHPAFIFAKILSPKKLKAVLRGTGRFCLEPDAENFSLLSVPRKWRFLLERWKFSGTWCLYLFRLRALQFLGPDSRMHCIYRRPTSWRWSSALTIPLWSGRRRIT